MAQELAGDRPREESLWTDTLVGRLVRKHGQKVRFTDPELILGSLRWHDRHREQVLISHDICTRTRLGRYGGHGYQHIFANIAPRMLRRGFTQEDVDAVEQVPGIGVGGFGGDEFAGGGEGRGEVAFAQGGVYPI